MLSNTSLWSDKTPKLTMNTKIAMQKDMSTIFCYFKYGVVLFYDSALKIGVMNIHWVNVIQHVCWIQRHLYWIVRQKCIQTVCGRCVKLLANFLRPSERVDLCYALGAARLHQLAQLPQGDAILRRPPLHGGHGAGLAAAARTKPDNPLAL